MRVKREVKLIQYSQREDESLIAKITLAIGAIILMNWRKIRFWTGFLMRAVIRRDPIYIKGMY